MMKKQKAILNLNRTHFLQGVVIACLFIVCVTTSLLVLPAITLTKKERVLDCQYKGHVHEEKCYQETTNDSGEKIRTLVCGYADFVIHTHDDNCYNEKGELICALPEVPEHIHDASCYDEEGKLICTVPELHTHSETCYDENHMLVCGKLQLESHQHDKKCFFEIETTEMSEEETTSTVMSMEDITADAAATESSEKHETPEMSTEDEKVILPEKPSEQEQKSSEQEQSTSGQEQKMPEQEQKMSEQEQVFTINTKHVHVTATAKAGTFPVDTTMEVQEVSDRKTLSTIKDAVDGDIEYVYAVDITFYDKEHHELEPAQPVRVSMTSDVEAKNVDPMVVHVDKKGDADIVDQVASSDTAVLFDADAFSIYAMVGTTLEKTVLASNGKNYKITVTYGKNAGIPENADLAVEEITDTSSVYEQYVLKTMFALGQEDRSADYVRLFDIKIVDKDNPDKKYQPEGSVDVRIELADRQTEKLNVVHFADGSTHGDPVDNSTVKGRDGSVVAFAADGFSVYSIVDLEVTPVEIDWTKASSIEDIIQGGSQGFYISHRLGYYLTNEITNINDTSRTGIIKTNKSDSPEDAVGKVPYYFEKVEGSTNKFYIYCYNSAGTEKKYVKQSTNSLSLVSESEKMAFTVESGNTGEFRIKGTGGYYWNMQGGEKGNAIAAYIGATDSNAQFCLWNYVEPLDDPYGLDGQTYGIAYHNDSAAAAALMGEAKDANHLVATDMLMRPDVLDNDGILLVAENSDITEWTFHSEGDDRYSITTEKDGITKYLTLNGQSLTLQDTKDEDHSIFTLIPGKDANAGKWMFSVNGYVIDLNLNNNNADRGFWGSNKSSAGWLNLVKKSPDLHDDDFSMYSAKKVSISDTEHVSDGQQIILYTRIWNEEKKKYEFYVVDYDGSLIYCYDTGDNIEWISTKVNRALWTFQEGTNSDGTPSYYYWLQNVQFPNTYIRPNVTEGQVIYTSTQSQGVDFNASVNLNGRRYGESYSTIIAWDDDNYSYAGLKAENGRTVAGSLSGALDFYVAIVNPVVETGQSTTVATVDNNDYGITMKMVDFNNPVQKVDGTAGNNTNGRDSGQTAVLGYDTNTTGLLDAHLGEDGYPATNPVNTKKDASSLSVLFNTEDAKDANHLFLESIHSESGYFEYDSTQNFAHFNENDGTFTVYDQLGAIGDYPGQKGTGRHGQFMPYDNITDNKYCSFTNETDVLANELPDTDPRKGEKLYNLGNRTQLDYFFGMEMEAGFTQTADGLDAWGHDIIFEFSGDDDFWLYVDGLLVLDLGGVHSAMTGSINFRTGEVKYVRGENEVNTTLYDIFKEYYGDDAEELFEEKVVDGKNVRVFKDYSKHTMKMFYMERGAGASNLHMRFNLAAVKPGTVELSKKLSGTDSASNSLIEFPYQIYYTSKADSEIHLLGKREGESDLVTFKNTISKVPYKSRFTAAEGDAPYEHVFFLKPGQTAVIELPEDALDYYIVECGINPAVYNKVLANGDELAGRNDTKPKGTTDQEGEAYASGRKNFSTTIATSVDRPQVEYDNHVADDAMRTLTLSKRLFDSDGETELTPEEDPSIFEFRLYLGNEYAHAGDVSGANTYPYYVKNKDGYYCRWNSSSKSFVALPYNDYNELQLYLKTLTDEQKESIEFFTSPNGSISKIPAQHTVEVHDLIVGTQWKVEERDGDIPKGYTQREEDGYVRTDLDPDEEYSTPVSGTMKAGDSPAVEIRNQKGWGLTVKKVWTDKDFMESHDPVYIAVYYRDDTKPNGLGEIANIYEQYTIEPEEEGDEPVIVPAQSTLRRLQSGQTQLYYFFDDLKDADKRSHPFSDFVVREVTVAAKEGKVITYDEEGYVTNPIDDLVVTPVEDKGPITIRGKAVNEDPQEYNYTVNYKVGDSTGQNTNIRTDTVTNSRPGIEFYKTDWHGNKLSGAVFTLKKANGEDVAAPTYNSDTEGYITTAYLSPKVYTLEETVAPRGYLGLDDSMEIHVHDNEGITFKLGDDTITMSKDGEISGTSAYFSVSRDEDSDMLARVTIKNRQNELKVIKKDEEMNQPISGVHFALYQQIVDENGNKRKNYSPMAGYEDLVTDEEGIPTQTVEGGLHQITMDLPPGTYYLTETHPQTGYQKLDDDICFTIERNGTVTMNDASHVQWLTSSHDGTSGMTVFTMTIPNGKVEDFCFHKIWYPPGDSVERLEWQKDITLTLYKNEQTHDITVAEYVIGMDNGRLFVRATSKITGKTAPELVAGDPVDHDYIFTIKDLPVGDDYYLKETEMDEYLIQYGKVDNGEIVIVPGADKATEEHNYIVNRNTAGYELPYTGGAGRKIFYILGILIAGLAGIGLVIKKKNEVKGSA